MFIMYLSVIINAVQNFKSRNIIRQNVFSMYNFFEKLDFLVCILNGTLLYKFCHRFPLYRSACRQVVLNAVFYAYIR